MGTICVSYRLKERIDEVHWNTLPDICHSHWRNSMEKPTQSWLKQRLIFAMRYKNWKNYVVVSYPTLLQVWTMKLPGCSSEFGPILIPSVNPSSYCSGLINIEHKYKKLIERHNRRSLTGRTKAYFFHAKKMKEQIKELREDVKDVKINFMAS